MTLKLYLLILLYAIKSYTISINYHRFKTYQIAPKNNQHFQAIKNYKNLDFWVELQNTPSVVVIPSSYQKQFDNEVLKKNINYKVIITNLQTAIQENKSRQKKPKPLKKGHAAFDRYLRYAEIQDYLNRLAVDFKEIVTVENYGLSFESRNLTLIKISSGRAEKKPLVFVDAGIHAREWITPAQALYIINQLVENPKNKNLIDRVDWIIVPLLNPDGYEYSHTEDRFWRKTRSKGQTCDGVDLNRNFNFHWLGKGADKDECSAVYAGSKPFSESESLALSQVLLRYADRVKLYITFHSPLQCLLYPYGCTSELPVNNKELLDLGLKVAESIYAVNKTKYNVGTSVQVFTYTSGSSRDWAYGVAKINLSYTVELPPYALSEYEIPPEKILGVIAEMFEGIKTFHAYIQNKFAVV